VDQVRQQFRMNMHETDETKVRVQPLWGHSSCMILVPLPPLPNKAAVSEPEQLAMRLELIASGTGPGDVTSACRGAHACSLQHRPAHSAVQFCCSSILPALIVI
jgi:hypothetical protein